MTCPAVGSLPGDAAVNAVHAIDAKHRRELRPGRANPIIRGLHHQVASRTQRFASLPDYHIGRHALALEYLAAHRCVAGLRILKTVAIGQADDVGWKCRPGAANAEDPGALEVLQASG